MIRALAAALALALAVPFSRGEVPQRWEPFVDAAGIELKDGVELRLAQPERREVVLTLDKPWEGPDSAYFTALRDGDRIRLYYRGYCPADASDKQATCMAESTDGIHFTRPNLGLYEFDGSRENNIVYRGVEAHNFAPFVDTNPAARRDERYKATAGINSKLYAFASPDGIHWRKLKPEPVLTKGAFDSLNTAFFDNVAGVYRLYSRFWQEGGYSGARAIQSCTSKDFLHWSDPVPNAYPAGAPMEHFYTNATRPCPGAEQVLLSFPKRFVPERTRREGYKEPGVSDAVFLSSRDGVHWDRTFQQAWVRPGRDEYNWTQRSNMPATGIVGTADDELSMYISEHYSWPTNRLRRLSIRRLGFASLHADGRSGTALLKPVILSGTRLLLNAATSAAGSVRAELLDESGRAIPGFSLGDCTPFFGDEIETELKWKGGSLDPLAGRKIRIRLEIRDADVYAWRLGP